MGMSLLEDKLTNLLDQERTLASQYTIHHLHRIESLVSHFVLALKVCHLGQAFLNNLFTVLSAMKAGQHRQQPGSYIADLG